MGFPRIIIAAMRGGAGKTILSIGIIAGWIKSGKSIAPFKKGPDYIDAGWLALAAGCPCHNLDTFLIKKELVLQSFLLHTKPGDIAVIEGNRGLYDGIDTQGSTSTAELAKLIKSPVILCVDCTKSTRTMAAAVLGCISFDPDINIKGVILNRVAGSRHENVLRKSIEYHCGISILGAVPKMVEQYFPERHMGLVPTPEHEWAKKSIDAAALMAVKCLDLNEIYNVALNAQDNLLSDELSESKNPLIKILEQKKSFPNGQNLKIGIIKDSAFQFYYPENIKALESAGAQIVFLSPLTDDHIVSIDGLYIGGGFPETHAKELENNFKFKKQLKSLATVGLPIYAECGGLMYLGRKLILDGKAYQMAGVFPVDFEFSKKPQGHGYTIITVEGENPYFKVGTKLKGHEFHYSLVQRWDGIDSDLIFRMKKGTGFINHKDGLCYKNVLATYTHIHALGTLSWAKAMIRNALAYKYKKAKKQGIY